jgi:hypothetical protein
LHGHYSRAGVKAYLDGLIAGRTPVHGVAGTFTLGPDHDPRRLLYVAEVRGQQFCEVKAIGGGERSSGR